ncbi:MAG: hypothetical protein ACJ76Z_14505 [Thermoleophilaceae bacterium]
MTNDERQKHDERALARVLEARRHRDEQSEALWRMPREGRVQAMWRGELSHFQLCEWSARAPHEVPRIATDLTPSGEAGELAWIVMQTPEWCDAGERRRS